MVMAAAPIEGRIVSRRLSLHSFFDNYTLVLFFTIISLYFFLRITQHNADIYNARALTPMNRRTQILSLSASLKTEPANP